MKPHPFLVAFAVSISIGCIADTVGVEGDWVPPAGDAILRIEDSDTLTVTLVRMLEPATLDLENPDQQLQSRRLVGAVIGEGFKRTDSTWTGGQLYDPDSGKTYRGRITLIDENHIELRGYVGTPLFGRSEVWTRLELFQSRMNTMLGQECKP